MYLSGYCSQQKFTTSICCQPTVVDSLFSLPSCFPRRLVCCAYGCISSANLSTSALTYIPCFLFGAVTLRIFPVSVSRLNVLAEMFNLFLASLDEDRESPLEKIVRWFFLLPLVVAYAMGKEIATPTAVRSTWRMAGSMVYRAPARGRSPQFGGAGGADLDTLPLAQNGTGHDTPQSKTASLPVPVPSGTTIPAWCASQNPFTVIGRYVSLYRRGLGCCPFGEHHSDGKVVHPPFRVQQPK